MKGYKATYSGKCQHITFKEGHSYYLEFPFKTVDGKKVRDNIKCNVTGYHFCQNPDDVVYYYDIKRADFELFEVEALGTVETIGDTSSTDILYIERKIPRSEYSKVFTKSYFELVGISRIYVWHNKMFADRRSLFAKEYERKGFLMAPASFMMQNIYSKTPNKMSTYIRGYL